MANSSQTQFSKFPKNLGPIFDKKHLSKKKMFTTVGIVVVVVLLLVVLPKFNSSDKPAESNQPKTAMISTVILKGDSKTTAARRAISEYLVSHSGVSLSAGQRLFMEENLRRTIADTPFKIGESVEFKIDTISELVTAAKALKATTLAKWEALAKGIKF